MTNSRKGAWKVYPFLISHSVKLQRSNNSDRRKILMPWMIILSYVFVISKKESLHGSTFFPLNCLCLDIVIENLRLIGRRNPSSEALIWNAVTMEGTGFQCWCFRFTSHSFVTEWQASLADLPIITLKMGQLTVFTNPVISQQNYSTYPE